MKNLCQKTKEIKLTDHNIEYQRLKCHTSTRKSPENRKNPAIIKNCPTSQQGNLL
jgi:hypothetical protein